MTDITEPGIDVTRDGPVAVVTIRNPQKRNALTLSMVEEFRTATEEADRDNAVRAIVVTGYGGTFSAGGDLNSLLPATLQARSDVINPDPAQRFLSRVFTPVIAAIEGVCFGGGLEIVLGTDLRVAAEDARFAFPETTWGLIPGSGSTVRLPAQLPWAIAMEMLLLGRVLTATRAYEVGLVNEVVSAGEALDTATQLALAVAAKGPIATRVVKESATRSAGLDAGFALEHALNGRVLSSSDAHQGVRAFQERRDPTFSGD